jgi:hypothetical protein
MTLAFGRSIALSPTLEKNNTFTLLSYLNFSIINYRSLVETSPQIKGIINFTENFFSAKSLSA